jgi:hypothetical protein
MSIQRPFLLLCPMVAAIVLVSAAGADPPLPQQNETAKQVESLLKERRDTFRQLVDMLGQQHRAGIVTEVSVLRATDQLLDAELDLASTKAERIAIREKLVANLRKLEKLIEGMVQAGVRGADAPTIEDALRAKAARLKAEIQLLREKAGNEPRPAAE